LAYSKYYLPPNFNLEKKYKIEDLEKINVYQIGVILIQLVTCESNIENIDKFKEFYNDN